MKKLMILLQLMILFSGCNDFSPLSSSTTIVGSTSHIMNYNEFNIVVISFAKSGDNKITVKCDEKEGWSFGLNRKPYYGDKKGPKLKRNRVYVHDNNVVKEYTFENMPEKVRAELDLRNL
ncbi:MAG: hypothetical protein ACRC37_05875 [Lentisphaeria bacterium]